ncbi:MAG: SDR family NAD(P)-dependent oxidoreductase [Candidatus Dormiibacterota bacterium]
MDDLKGKTVLLTGASTGLGPHIARRLHESGVKFVLSARSEAALKKLAKELGGSRVIVADLARAGEPERLAEEAGHVDVLVSNAGVPASGRLATFTIEEIDRARSTCAQASCSPIGSHPAGHIVFLSSIAGKVPAAGATIYNATKFGLRGSGLALREELWGTEVGVSVIYPTFVNEAGMWAETGLKANPMAGEVSPAEVAGAVWSAITKNRGEVDVAPIQLRAGLVLQALAPGLFTAVARSTGASSVGDELGDRQRTKR